MNYSHSASKTTIELWFCNNFSGWIERNFFPECFTPNVVTLLGNIPLIALATVWMLFKGPKMTVDEHIEDCWFIYVGLCLLWFSQHDIIDGVRARRQRSGSPIGRIIDEALDMVQQACYSVLMGFMFKWEYLPFELIMLCVNAT